MKEYDVIVIGGGASGMMASIFSARNNNKTLILEHNEKLGKKLFITGKGRCNLTNNSSIENHMENIITNPKFMFSALNFFSPNDVMNFFINNNCMLKTERGNRVFPLSDKSSDVIKCLENKLKELSVDVMLNSNIEKISKANNKFNIVLKNGNSFICSNLILATGGLSYPGTGATDFGYKICKQFGHSIVEPKSSLCPIVLKEDVSSLNGLSLKNVKLTVEVKNKTFNQMGEMMFTYNSITGPIALTLSSFLNKFDLQNARISLDLKPALSTEQLTKKFLKEFKENSTKDFKNYLKTLLPSKLLPYFFDRLKIENKKLSQITRPERDTIIKNLKTLSFTIKKLESIDASIVTSGGVNIKEINSKTCESKKAKNLFIVGELLDVDALTGGYNLQIAWSTGALAGNSTKRI